MALFCLDLLSSYLAYIEK